MDPALHELIEKGSADDWVEALLRRKSVSSSLPSYIKEITRFRDISTIRIQRKNIRRAWRLDSIASLKAPRLLTIDAPRLSDRVDLSQDTSPPRMTALRRAPGQKATGKGTVFACLDWGFDFAHRAFRNADGSSRILALWDQNKFTGDTEFNAPQPWGYGRVFSRDDINRALKTDNPYEALSYYPKDKAHGTHVADIGAGSRRGRYDGGMAPDADIILIQMSKTRSGGPRSDMGDTVALPEAIDFVHKVAGRQPCVINMSMGRHGGAKDGGSLVERGMDNFLTANKNRMIVQSTGNYFESETHSFTQLFAGHSRTLYWKVSATDRTQNEMEFWYSNKDVIMVQVTPPGSKKRYSVPLGQVKIIRDDAGRRIAKVYHRKNDPNTPSHHVDIFLDNPQLAGTWKIKIRPLRILDGKVHGWIERDASFHQSRYSARSVNTETTIGSICTGFLPLAVGAAENDEADTSPTSFASSGPTRDNRQKPDIGAPGMDIIAARSYPMRGGKAHNKLTRMMGASQASPYVAGIVACCMEAASKPLSCREIRKVIQGSAHPTRHTRQLGVGIVNPVKAEILASKR